VSAFDLAVPDDLADNAELSQDALLTERIRPVYAMIGQTSWSTMGMSMIAAAVLYDQRPQVWIWLAVQIMLKLGNQVELRWFASDALLAQRPRWMARRLCISESFHAAGWASVVWVAGAHGSPAQVAIVAMILAGIIAGGTCTYGPYAPVHYTYLATFVACQLIIAWLFRLIAVSNPIAFILPILLVLYCLGVLNNSRVTTRTFREHIMLSFANANLARRLSQQVAAVDAARREAEAANLAKSTFLASASHDLRQPIHALGLFLALLERSPLNDSQQQALGRCKAAATASSAMLDTLLDFSRSEAGVIEPYAHPFVIGDVLGSVEQEIGILADDKRVVYRTHDCQAVVASDAALVKMIIFNLVSNAIRYTLRGGVLVGCRRRGGALVVEVWDSGIGIAQEDLGRIFEEFVQLENPERDRRKGLGLGLAIAARMARLLGSEITVRSVVGRGSVFRFALPLAPEQALTIPAVSPSPALARPLQQQGSRHILLVDDDETIRIGLSAVLIAEGHSVDAADGLDDALEYARQRTADLIICDFRLRGGQSGLDVVARLRAEAAHKIPALLITGDTHPDRVALAARADMEVLYKPVDADVILSRVAQLSTT